ncbi:MAG: toxin-antitoxin system YwqK family antitoxin [Bacteroidota bacterium]
MKRFILTFISIAFSAAIFAGNTYVEYWPDGKKKVEGSYNAPVQINDNDSKEVKAGKLANAVKVGKWTYWHQNGQLAAEQYYTNGAMTGTWKQWYQNGALELEINFTTGDAKIYYQNGQVESTGKMLDGMLKDGAWVSYHDNGTKNTEGVYKKNQKDGVWKYWDRDGKLIGTENWKNGQLVQ